MEPMLANTVYEFIQVHYVANPLSSKPCHVVFIVLPIYILMAALQHANCSLLSIQHHYCSNLTY